MAEKRQDMILKAEAEPVGVVAVVNRECILDPIRVQRFVECLRIGARSILIPDLDRDSAVAAQPIDVLVEESEWRVSVPFRQDVRP